MAALKAPNPVEAAEQPLQVLSQGINLLFSITTPSVEEHKLKHQCVDVESKLNALLKEHAILYHCTMVHVTAYRQWLLQLPPDYYMLSTCARWASMQGQLINYPRKETFIEAEYSYANVALSIRLISPFLVLAGSYLPAWGLLRQTLTMIGKSFIHSKNW